MKSNKEIVFEYMQRCAQSAPFMEDQTFTTQELSEQLKMQRTNISTLLNILLAENKVEKIAGRPVHYRLVGFSDSIKKEETCFKKLIGFDGSLKHAVQLVKAATLYPEQSLHTLILGPGGSGKSFLAALMYEFAKESGVINQDAPFIKFNCRYYDGLENDVYGHLFGKPPETESALHKSKGGILFIDHIDLLPAIARDKLFELMEFENREIKKTIIICAANDSIKKSLLDAYSAKFSVRVDLPSLQSRKMEERFALVQHFFIKEALHMNKVIHINSELLRCILLYRCDLNVKQLKSDIKIGCANGYVRDFNKEASE